MYARVYFVIQGGCARRLGGLFYGEKEGISLRCCWRGCKHLPPRAAGPDASQNGLAGGGALGLVCRGLIVLCNGEPTKMSRTTNSLGGRVSCRAGPTKRGCSGRVVRAAGPKAEQNHATLFSVEKTKNKFWKLPQFWSKSCHLFRSET